MSVLFLTKGSAEFDTPECGNPQLEDIVKEFKAVFCTTPGKTNDAHHYIDTLGNPVSVHLDVFLHTTGLR